MTAGRGARGSAAAATLSALMVVGVALAEGTSDCDNCRLLTEEAASVIAVIDSAAVESSTVGASSSRTIVRMWRLVNSVPSVFLEVTIEPEVATGSVYLYWPRHTPTALAAEEIANRDYAVIRTVRSDRYCVAEIGPPPDLMWAQEWQRLHEARVMDLPCVQTTTSTGGVFFVEVLGRESRRYFYPLRLKEGTAETKAAERVMQAFDRLIVACRKK